jgi:pyruvate/2-oxoglutarate/acetoin dehydrogenase E1 component
VIAVPATVQDCYDLFWASCLSARPVLFFEPKMLYRRKDIATPLQRGIPEQPIEHFGARIVCEGTDITLVTFGAMVHVAESAAQEVHTIDGVSVEVIDLRVIKPYDFETIEKSISKTGRLIVAHEGGFAGSVAQMIISDVSMRLLDTLVAPPVAVTAPAIDFPPHAAYKAYLVDKDDMVAGMRDVLDLEKQY